MSIVFAALALMAAAQDSKWIDGWNVWKSDDECIMAAEYEGGTTLAISRDWTLNRITVTIIDDRWKSLGTRDGETVRADYELLGKNLDYDQWYSDKAVIVSNPEKELYGVRLWWDGEEDGDDFWPAWALATGVEVKIDGKIVGRYTLKGTRAAELELARCSGEALKNDRSDPFAK